MLLIQRIDDALKFSNVLQESKKEAIEREKKRNERQKINFPIFVERNF